MATDGKLTVVGVKSAGPGKHFDGGGLYLHVTKNGARYWRLKYRYGGREKTLAFGVFPEVTLAEARQRRHAARTVLRAGNDPSAEREASREAARRTNEGAFVKVSSAWLAAKKLGWADATYRKAEYVVRTFLDPPLRTISIAELTTKKASDVLMSIAAAAPSLALKARQYLNDIVAYSIREGLRDEGRLLLLKGAIPPCPKGHIPAATEPKLVRALVAAVRAYPVPVTRAALLLTMLTAMRPGVVASARWEEIDLEAGEWHVPAGRMKAGHDHIVPLPTQAQRLLRDMLAYTDGHQFVFAPLARQRTPHLHRDSLSAALRRMGFAGRHATHGFRGMLRTVARERLGIDPDVLEAQLAHAKHGDVQKAYDRTRFDAVRREVMQQWADFLLEDRSNGRQAS